MKFYLIKQLCDSFRIKHMNKCLKELIFNYIKNRLSDINIYKSCSYKVNVVRVDIFNRI